MQEYKGYRELVLTDEQYQELYTKQTLKDLNFNENEYLIVENEHSKPIDKFCY